MLQFQQYLFLAFFLQMMSHVPFALWHHYFIIPSPSILNIWSHGGLTALHILFSSFDKDQSFIDTAEKSSLK